MRQVAPESELSRKGHLMSVQGRGARLAVEDIRGAWAIIPTPATPDAADPAVNDTVDLDETARVVDELIEAGVDGILSLGTLGECAALTWEEKRAFIAAM